MLTRNPFECSKKSVIFHFSSKSILSRPVYTLRSAIDGKLLENVCGKQKFSQKAKIKFLFGGRKIAFEVSFDANLNWSEFFGFWRLYSTQARAITINRHYLLPSFRSTHLLVVFFVCSFFKCDESNELIPSTDGKILMTISLCWCDCVLELFLVSFYDFLCSSFYFSFALEAAIDDLLQLKFSFWSICSLIRWKTCRPNGRVYCFSFVRSHSISFPSAHVQAIIFDRAK